MVVGKGRGGAPRPPGGRQSPKGFGGPCEARLCRSPNPSPKPIGSAPQDADFILNWYGAGSFNGKPYWKNDKFEAAYSGSQKELDPQKRLAVLQQASVAMREDPPVIFGIQTTSLWGVNKKVKNFVGATAVWFDEIQIVKV